ncbi:MAG: hypothetical protein ACRENE_17665, partial [Polyangiaceae bacterium]
LVLVWGGILIVCALVVRALARWARGRTLLRRRRGLLLLADLPFVAGVLVVLVLGCVQAFASLVKPTFNPNDDSLAYFPFAREILDRGTLTQPFSLRRISAYGGKSLLDAIQLAIDVPETHLHLLDKGLGLLTILALVVGHARAAPKTSRALVLLAMLFVVALPDTGINTSSMRTAVVFFLGLYRTLSWAPVAGARGVRPAIPVALLAAGACTLRQNFLVTIAFTLVLAYGRPIAGSLPLRSLHARGRAAAVDRSAVIDAAWTAGLLSLFLLPWWALSLRWCGTFLFPVSKGFYDAGYAFFPSRSSGDWVRYVGANAFWWDPVKAVPLFLLAAVTIRDPRPRSPLAAITWGAVAGFLGLLLGYSNGHTENQSRYHFGFTFAAVLAVSLAAADLASRRAPAGRIRAAQVVSVPLVLMAISLQLFVQRDITAATYRTYFEKVTSALSLWEVPGRDPDYQKLQDAVPAGAPIATLVDFPSHFDFARNRIACLDMIGAVSPPPGIPLGGGGEAVADYLVGKGYRYVVVIRPGAASDLYRRDVWERQQKGEDPIWRASAPFYLEAFDAFDDLRRTRVHLADARDMVTLDLTRRQP